MHTFCLSINDSPEHAEALARLLRERGSWAHLYHIDLIPYNPTDKTVQKFASSNPSRVRAFSGKLRAELRAERISITVRAQFGSDMDAACGQLYGEMKNEQ